MTAHPPQKPLLFYYFYQKLAYSSHRTMGRRIWSFVVVARFQWMFHTFALSAFRHFLGISWKHAFSRNVSQLRPLWISIFSQRRALGQPLCGVFSSDVSHYPPVGSVGCCIRFDRRKSSQRLNLHTVLASRHIFWALGGHIFSVFQGCSKSRRLVFDDCFTFSACRAVVLCAYIFLQKCRNLSIFSNC